MLPIRFVTIHCAATPEGKHFLAGQITAMDVLRFRQPSYHWVVELDGTTVATLPEHERGAHVAGHNTGNIGVCYVGGVERDGRSPKDTRTPAQTLALRALVAALRARHGDVEILGHRDWPDVSKACPSFDVKLAPGLGKEALLNDSPRANSGMGSSVRSVIDEQARAVKYK